MTGYLRARYILKFSTGVLTVDTKVDTTVGNLDACSLSLVIRDFKCHHTISSFTTDEVQVTLNTFESGFVSHSTLLSMRTPFFDFALI